MRGNWNSPGMNKREGRVNVRCILKENLTGMLGEVAVGDE